MMVSRVPMVVAAIFLMGAASETKRVEIDGRRYRVTTQAGTVIVANKGAVVAYSVEERDRQRAAVLKATGCRIVDELPANDARLRGKLECPPL